MSVEQYKVFNHETEETLIFDNIKDLIEFMNGVDDVFSFEINRKGECDAKDF